MTATQTLPEEETNMLALRLPVNRRGRWALPLVLAIAGALLFVVNQRHESTLHRAADARKVVTAHVEELLTYDYRNIDDDLATEKDWLTGSFESKYAELVSNTIAPAAKKAKVTTKAAVSAAGVVKAEHDEVSLLLFVDVTTTSSELSAPRVSGSRLAVTAKYVDGQWRIIALDPV